MPMDIATIGSDGTPERTVSLSVEEHSALMRVADENGCRLIQRMRDCYGETRFGVEDLTELGEELRSIAAGLPERIRGLVGSLSELALDAHRAGKSLHV